ncbi:MAG: Rpp14/Pop5 family protein [Candidatus Nanoarchaeia archaeon]|nr:hypothetical protein [Candidatus Haiyanarchaeum thermophilum]MCW1303020.1 hypothetical protein [Candidatus Haiyanarchaeum thermophilum]MCW1303698.1 hypothetical protein [Candidatus Haiyanarchaeum thermophilum]MCW1306378.1 hypothetical protein [Candidatus Haiyanarchaeum thermophilum]MCW1307112.1 hypothetical protein [Candidatus Haiyanarchaeum thermophilum]
MREKKRYVLVEIYTEGDVDILSVFNLIRSQLKSFIGEQRFGAAKLQFIERSGNFMIMKVGHRFVDELKLSLSLVSQANNKFINLAVLYVSGSLRKIREIMRGA